MEKIHEGNPNEKEITLLNAFMETIQRSFGIDQTVMLLLINDLYYTQKTIKKERLQELEPWFFENVVKMYYEDLLIKNSKKLYLKSIQKINEQKNKIREERKKKKLNSLFGYLLEGKYSNKEESKKESLKILDDFKKEKLRNAFTKTLKILHRKKFHQSANCISMIFQDVQSKEVVYCQNFLDVIVATEKEELETKKDDAENINRKKIEFILKLSQIVLVNLKIREDEFFVILATVIQRIKDFSFQKKDIVNNNDLNRERLIEFIRDYNDFDKLEKLFTIFFSFNDSKLMYQIFLLLSEMNHNAYMNEEADNSNRSNSKIFKKKSFLTLPRSCKNFLSWIKTNGNKIRTNTTILKVKNCLDICILADLVKFLTLEYLEFYQFIIKERKDPKNSTTKKGEFSKKILPFINPKIIDQKDAQFAFGDDSKNPLIYKIVRDRLALYLFNFLNDKLLKHSDNYTCFEVIEKLINQKSVCSNITLLHFKKALKTTNYIIQANKSNQKQKRKDYSFIKFYSFVMWNLNYSELSLLFDFLLENQLYLSNAYQKDAIIFSTYHCTMVSKFLKKLDKLKFKLNFQKDLI